MDLNEAVGKHAEWKLKFRQAITDHATMDAVTIAKDNCCDLGKWLHGEARAKLGNYPAYAECVTKHAAFHVEAGNVAQAINAKNFAAAEKMISSETSYLAASSAVGLAIMRLKKEASL